MGVGMRFWDAAGNLIFDTPDRIGRIVGTVTTAAGGSGSQNFTVPAGCTPFWFASSNSRLYGCPSVTISGGTLSWSGGDATTIFYGYY